MSNWTQTVERYLREGRTVSGGKGDNSKAEMDRANQLQQQEFNLMQQQLSQQNAIQQQALSVLNPIINEGGMSPGQESAMTSLAVNQLPQDFAQTRSALNTNLLQRGVTGGNMAGSGDLARGFGQLGAAEDYMKSNLLNQIQVQKANQLYQALGLKLGVGGMYGQNTGLFNNGSLNALGIGQKAAQSADQASSSFWGSLLGAVGSIGGGFASGFAGGLGSKSGGCWIAAAYFDGWDDPRTSIVREWLWTKFVRHWYGRIIMRLYMKYGERLAKRKWIVKLLGPLFDAALRRASNG